MSIGEPLVKRHNELRRQYEALERDYWRLLYALSEDHNWEGVFGTPDSPEAQAAWARVKGLRAKYGVPP